MENKMKNLFTLFAGLVLITNCASIGSVVEGTKEFTTGVVDGAVKGTSTVVSAVASDVVSTGEFVVETAVDVSGSTNYVVISTTQFMSVPYALYSKKTGSSQNSNTLIYTTDGF